MNGNYEQLLYTGNYGGSEGIAFSILEAEYGEGHFDAVVVGDPVRKFSLRFNSLVGAGTPLIDGGNGAESRADYIWNFFCRHKRAGNAPFWVTSHRTQEQVLVKFVEHELTYEIVIALLFSTGLSMTEVRMRNVTPPEVVPNPDQI